MQMLSKWVDGVFCLWQLWWENSGSIFDAHICFGSSEKVCSGDSHSSFLVGDGPTVESPV